MATLVGKPIGESAQGQLDRARKARETSEAASESLERFRLQRENEQLRGENLLLQQQAKEREAAAAAAPPPAAGGPANIAEIAAGLEQHRGQQAAQQARQQFVQQHMAGMPAAYTNLLGADPAQWPAEAEKLRRDFRLDFGLATPQELIGAGLEGRSATPRSQLPGAEAPKPSALELIHRGLEQ